ncbi:MAG TPA: hypothetical protein VM782_01195 [Stellaceae bacterium]|nr:hypothetical protein [Stellaceae bacterium]
MARVRYQVDGVHHNAWASAFFPAPGLTPAGTSSVRRFIHGQPGTERVPSPRPAGAISMTPNPAYIDNSHAAPDWFAPQLWWQDIAWKGANVAPSGSERGVSYMPKPVAAVVPPITPIGALGPLGPAEVAMGGRKIAGRRSMKWLRTVVRWPDLQGNYE